MPKNTLKEKVDGKELDLSLNNLTSVPVRDIVTIPKATHLDLSCNLLTSITDDFCSLTHLVKLDLSKNQITSLPRSFGALQRLQSLDLFSNKLTALPVSFCHLQNLKWLDVKDNPLDVNIQAVAGDCLNEEQCKACAKQVVIYMKSVQSEQERQLQRRLEEERKQELSRKQEEEKQRRLLKAEKMAQKDQRRLEYEARQREKTVEESRLKQNIPPPDEGPAPKSVMTPPTKAAAKEKGGLSCCGVLLSVLIGLVALVAGLVLYCNYDNKDAMCLQGRRMALDYYKQTKDFVASLTKQK